MYILDSEEYEELINEVERLKEENKRLTNRLAFAQATVEMYRRRAIRIEKAFATFKEVVES